MHERQRCVAHAGKKQRRSSLFRKEASLTSYTANTCRAIGQSESDSQTGTSGNAFLPSVSARLTDVSYSYDSRWFLAIHDTTTCHGLRQWHSMAQCHDRSLYALYDVLDMCHHRREPERQLRLQPSVPPSTIPVALR